MDTDRPAGSADVEGADALFEWFGYWPDFHDAEVLSVHLDRGGTSSVVIHTWEATGQADSKGYYSQRKHALVSFLLDGVTDVEPCGFSGQNVISGAEIERIDSEFSPALGPCFGLSGRLRAAKLRIRIEPAIEPALLTGIS